LFAGGKCFFSNFDQISHLCLIV
jgi:hypothetical protein